MSLLLIYLALAGCSTDRRKDIAYHVLFSTEGALQTEAFAMALSSRFPPGSSVSALQSFIQTSGGNCREREPGHLWCEFVTRAQFCSQSMLGVDITVQSGSVGAIKITTGGLGC
jgi:hypothetical protein